MLSNLFEFINSKWKQMPKSVQIFTYLFILFLFSYLLLSPQYIDGKLMGINEDGNEYAIQHETFELDVDGRVIRFVTNSRGRFAIPKPNKFPIGDIELTFFPKGIGDKLPETSITIPFKDSIIGRTKIINTDGRYTIAHLPGKLSNIFDLLLTKSAYAGDEALKSIEKKCL